MRTQTSSDVALLERFMYICLLEIFWRVNKSAHPFDLPKFIRARRQVRMLERFMYICLLEIFWTREQGTCYLWSYNMNLLSSSKFYAQTTNEAGQGTKYRLYASLSRVQRPRQVTTGPIQPAAYWKDQFGFFAQAPQRDAPCRSKINSNFWHPNKL